MILIEALTNPLDAETVARKFMITIASPIALENAVVQVNASIGIAYLSPPAWLNRVALPALDDGAFYQAKREGKKDLWRCQRLKRRYRVCHISKRRWPNQVSCGARTQAESTCSTSNRAGALALCSLVLS